MADKPQAEGPGLIEQLREAIRGDGRSLYKLGMESGVGPDQLSRFMSGKRTLTAPAIDKLCRTLRLKLVPCNDEAALPAPAPPPTAARPRRKKPDA